MKRLFLFLMLLVFVLASSTVYAAEKAPLGIGNLAVKLDYIKFTAEEVENSDVDTGFYVGLEGYGEITPNLYLGGEVGYANPEGEIDILGIHFDTEVTFVPIELNLKYVVKVAPNFVIDLGTGVSYNYIEEKVSALGVSASIDDWLFGGQFFVDLNYAMDRFFVGVNAKYQLTEDFDVGNYNYNNWRIGGQLGIMF